MFYDQAILLMPIPGQTVILIDNKFNGDQISLAVAFIRQ